MKAKKFTYEAKLNLNDGFWSVTGKVFASIIFPIVLVNLATWSYTSAINELAESFSTKFDTTVKYKITNDLCRHYDEMVLDFEKTYEILMMECNLKKEIKQEIEEIDELTLLLDKMQK